MYIYVFTTCMNAVPLHFVETENCHSDRSSDHVAWFHGIFILQAKSYKPYGYLSLEV